MSYKKFVIAFMSGFLAVFTVFAVINFWFDFHSVFRQEEDLVYKGVNDRYAKIAYLTKNPQKYEGYLFGSSRIKKIDTTMISKKTYNMGYDSGDGINEWLRDIKTLLQNNVNIKNIYLSIDDNSYKGYSEKIWDGVRWVPYRTDRENLIYKGQLLMQIPDFKKIKNQLFGRNNGTYTDLRGSGRIVIPDSVEKRIEMNLQNHIIDSKFLKPRYVDDSNEHIQTSVGELKEIKRICDENKIQLIVFFNVVHITSYLADDIRLLNKFKKEIANVTDFYDFSGVNFITVNNYFWYETSHPREFTGKYIISRILNRNLEMIPNGFGKLVTKDNVDEHILEMIKEREQFLKQEHKQYIPKDNDKFVFE